MTAESLEVASVSLQSQYDAKIDACLVELRRLREARNADCSHTRMLPMEVLTLIFETLAKDANYIKSYPTLPSWIGWAVVTHVCRTWRTAALNEPRLWTDLSQCHSSSSRWVNEMWIRSKAAPLSVHLTSRNSGFYHYICERTLQSPERIKSLTINGKNYLHRLRKPMPSLEMLSLNRTGSIPDDFACGRAPRLHCLELNDVIIPLNASWFSNVRVLSLLRDWSPTNTSHPLTVKSFLAFLSRLPRLVYLTVCLPGNMDATVCPSSGDVTQLSLKFWKVDARLSPIGFVEIVKATVVDKLEKFEVSLSDYVPDSAIISTAAFFLTNTCAHPDTVECQGGQIRFIQSAHIASKERSLSLNLYTDTLVSDLSIDHVKTLKLSQHVLSPFFPMRQSRTIEELQVDGDMAFAKLTKFKPTGGVSLPYPSLRRLHLRKVHFEPKSETISRLKRWIHERRTSSLEKLTIEDCGLNDEDIALLEKSIPVDYIPSARGT